MTLTTNEYQLEPVEGTDALECGRILFEGGADPTVHAHEESSYIVLPIFWEALQKNSVVSLIRIPLQYNYLPYAGVYKNDSRLIGRLL